jgi:hypothetical protein
VEPNLYLGLVNGALVTFYGFAETTSTIISDDHIISPKYMLMKLNQDVGLNIQLPGLSPFVVPIEPVKFTFDNVKGGRGVTLKQFPATLAYAMTDYKCQGQTFSAVIIDIKKPTGRGSHSSPSTSAYVQLSRSKTLAQCSIVRGYSDEDLCENHSADLLKELDWQEQMAQRTIQMYL